MVDSASPEKGVRPLPPGLNADSAFLYCGPMDLLPLLGAITPWDPPIDGTTPSPADILLRIRF